MYPQRTRMLLDLPYSTRNNKWKNRLNKETSLRNTTLEEEINLFIRKKKRKNNHSNRLRKLHKGKCRLHLDSSLKDKQLLQPINSMVLNNTSLKLLTHHSNKQKERSHLQEQVKRFLLHHLLTSLLSRNNPKQSSILSNLKNLYLVKHKAQDCHHLRTNELLHLHNSRTAFHLQSPDQLGNNHLSNIMNSNKLRITNNEKDNNSTNNLTFHKRDHWNNHHPWQSLQCWNNRMKDRNKTCPSRVIKVQKCKPLTNSLNSTVPRKMYLHHLARGKSWLTKSSLRLSAGPNSKLSNHHLQLKVECPLPHLQQS